MLEFDQIPPTVDGTEIDPSIVRTLSYGIEDRCINGIAEACASIVICNTADLEVIKGIGDKITKTIANSEKSKYPEDDASCFGYRYDDVVLSLLRGAAKTNYRKLVREARNKDETY